MANASPETVRLFVGFDQRQAAAYHVFCQTVLERASLPVSFTPLTREIVAGFDGQRDGSNSFIYSRFLVPYLCAFSGWAIFADGDMVCERDIADLWRLKTETIDRAVCVVRHQYKTRSPRKYVGSSMEAANTDYPCKNWSSLMLWNCGHFGNRVLTPEFVGAQLGSYLHRFQWLKEGQVGSLPHWWNHLVGEDPPGGASLYHFTLGVPGIEHYVDDYESWKWHTGLVRALECAGESAPRMTARSQSRVGSA